MKSTYPLPASVVAAAALTLAGCASSKPGRGGPPQGGGMAASARINGPIARPVSMLFAGMDADHDMIVSRNEVDAMAGVNWNRLAGSKDTITALTLAGWLESALGSPDAQPSTVAFDNNFDGQITRLEFETRLQAEFSELDTSKDGRLTRDELVFALPFSRERNSSGPSGRPQQGGGMPPRR